MSLSLSERLDRALLDADLVKACEVVLITAMQVDDAIPNKERRMLGSRSHMPALAMSFQQRWDAFGGDAADAAKKESEEIQARRSRRISLTPYNVRLWEMGTRWLAWLKQQNNGPRDFRIIRALGRDVPVVVIAGRSGQSDDTIRRWLRAAMEAIMSKPGFRRDIEALA